MSSEETRLLISPEFYFQPVFQVGYCPGVEKKIAAGKHPDGLTPLPQLQFSPDTQLSELTAACGWNDEGLAIDWELKRPAAPVKARSPQKSPTSMMTLLIDTRDLKSNRRTTRFCHQLQILLPEGTGSKPQIRRAAFSSVMSEIQPLPGTLFALAGSSQPDGFRVSCWLQKELLTGYDPENVPSLGFYYRFECPDLGTACFGLGSEFPVDTDPSLWPSLKLIR